MRFVTAFFAVIVCVSLNTEADNLANPLAPLPPARVAVGVSYNFEGHTITNMEVNSVMNRILLRGTYSPLEYIDIGAGLGAGNTEVESFTTSQDRYSPVFQGKYSFAWELSLQLTTPMLNDMFGLTSIINGSGFSSENDEKAEYSGHNATGGVGMLFHIPNIGYASAGARMHLIRGTSRSYSGKKGSFSNINNLRGWIAFEYYPKLENSNKTVPYLGIEVSLSPDAGVGGSVPIKDMGISLVIGAVTKRLYGKHEGAEWRP